MSCGKRPLVKLWDKPKKLRTITPSRYEQNEASVKIHWRNVVKTLEDSYKDDQFWETNMDHVRELVGPTVFRRIAKIFDLPLEATKYAPKSETSSIVPSENFYIDKGSTSKPVVELEDYSISHFGSEEEEKVEEEFDAEWSSTSTETETTTGAANKKNSKIKAGKSSSRSINVPKSLSKLLSKSFSRCISRTLSKSPSGKLKSLKSEQFSTTDISAASSDDLHVVFSQIVRSDSEFESTFEVTPVEVKKRKPKGSVATTNKRSRKDDESHSEELSGGSIPAQYKRTHRYDTIEPIDNPHFEMLYCNESETDMIKWDSHYKQKAFEVSASDEFSKRAEILAKKISKEFYDWWVSLGNVEFKSEIKRPEDIESLFQIWFDEHASRGLMLNPKIIPCVLERVAEYSMSKRSSCPNALKRQLAYDIHAETSPAHTRAFNTSLPHKLKHIPPRNNTKQLWDCVRIPQELKTMSYVWDDIQHLTSTKSFKEWLQKHPSLPVPPCLEVPEDEDAKKTKFMVPSDFILTEKTSTTMSVQELALPVSQLTLELKQVLNKLMND